jgi:CspA family cold shock protein
MSTINKATGTVKCWITDKGFGFIVGDDGEDYFLHVNQVRQSGLEPPRPGGRLTFTAESGPKGKRAIGVSAEAA